MDIAKVLAQLRSELSNINVAIESLERLERGSRGRGRPRKSAAGDAPLLKARAAGTAPNAPAGRKSGARNS